jgi:hypothetical protein
MITILETLHLRMITVLNTKNLIKVFFLGLTTGYDTKEEFLSNYYRALLCNSEVRHLKRLYQAGEYLKLRNRMDKIINSEPPTEAEFDTQFNLTLYNIIKYHLDEFIGKENSDKNLESIRTELTNISNMIFFNNPPYTLHIQDTTNLRDESKTDGSKFSVRIVPNQLLF